MQIQTFETTKIWDLQRLVNDFLKTKESTDIVDIKYNQSPIRLGRDEFEESITEYTAMVIYNIETADSVPTGIKPGEGTSGRGTGGWGNL
jgi:hypothetical protein